MSYCDECAKRYKEIALLRARVAELEGQVPFLVDCKDGYPNEMECVLGFDSNSNCAYGIGKYEVCSGKYINGKWMWFAHHIVPTHWARLPDFAKQLAQARESGGQV